MVIDLGVGRVMEEVDEDGKVACRVRGKKTKPPTVSEYQCRRKVSDPGSYLVAAH